MTTTTTQESYVVYELEPEPFPAASVGTRLDDYDKKYATAICLFIIIASVVLICLFFLLGHTFGYVLLIILVVLSVALLFVYFTRRPLFVSVFGLRPTTSVKVPKYAFRVIPAQQLTLNNNNTGVDASANSGFYVYPYPNISPSPVYTTQTTTKNHY